MRVNGARIHCRRPRLADHRPVEIEAPATPRRQPAWWLWLLLINLLLALPTAFSSSGLLSSITYLTGLLLLTGILFTVTLQMPARDRRPWLLLCAVAVAWLAGDVVQRVLDAPGLSP